MTPKLVNEMRPLELSTKYDPKVSQHNVHMVVARIAAEGKIMALLQHNEKQSHT